MKFTKLTEELVRALPEDHYYRREDYDGWYEVWQGTDGTIHAWAEPADEDGGHAQEADSLEELAALEPQIGFEFNVWEIIEDDGNAWRHRRELSPYDLAQLEDAREREREEAEMRGIDQRTNDD